MIVPSKGALLALAAVCLDVVSSAKGGQTPLKSSKDKAKYRAACPAYEHYARFMQ